MAIFGRSTLRAVFCRILLLLSLFISPCYAIDLSSAEQAYLRAKGTIVFVSQTHYPPFEFIDANRQHEGMMLDVVRWMAMEMGFHPVFVDMTFQQAQDAVLAGKADVLTSLFSSEQRQERFAFTATLFEVPASIFVRTERTDIKDVQDLDGKTIAIQQGDYAKEFLKSRNIAFETVDTRNFAEAIDKVRADTADAVIGDEQIVLHQIFSNRMTVQIKKMGEPLYIGKNCMATNRGNALLIGILNKGIEEAKHQGVLGKIRTKWLGTQYAPQVSAWGQYGRLLAGATVSLLLILLGVWGWNVRLRVMVRRKTEEIARNEAILRDSEEQFRSIFNNSLDGIFLTAPDGQVFAANGAVSQMTGWSEREICDGRRDRTVDLSDPRLPLALAERNRTGRFQGVLNFKRKDGTSFPAELSSTLFTLANGDVRSCIIFRDISERLQTEQKLFNALREQQIILDTANIGISMVADRKMKWANRKILEMFQYSQEEITGLALRKLYPSQQEFERLGRAAYPVLTRGDIFETEQELLRRDGTPIRVKYNAQRIDPADMSQGAIWVMEDITGRDQAREALRESEEKYRRIFENQLIAICVFDPETFKILDTNTTHVRLYGYSREELLKGMVIQDLSAAPGTTGEILRFARADEGVFIPLRYHKKKDGTVFPVEIAAESCLLNGRLVMFGIVRDISKRKKMEDALRTSEERLTLALTASQDAIWDWDLAADKIYCSPRWWAMVGYQTDELAADSSLWQRVTHPDDLERAQRVLSKALAGESSFELETRQLHKQGYYLPVLTRGVILRDDRSTAIRASGTYTDLTARKQSEEEHRQWERQLQQLQKTESLDRMAGAIAHHFNNLLMVVMGSLETAMDELPEVGVPFKFLSTAQKAAARAAEVGGLMLTYLGQSITQLEPLPLADLCRNSLPLLNSSLARGVVLQTDFPVPGPTINANPSQLERMLKNLVINGSEAIGPGQGSIRLTLKTVSSTIIPVRHRFPVEWFPQDDLYVCLEVKDTGCGIAEEDIDKIFDPFFSSKFTGRGLGLSVVLGILRSHCGGIVVESEPGRGSAFRIFLPLSPEKTALPPKSTALPALDGKKNEGGTVLLVEDDASVRAMAQTMLAHLQFTVIEARDGLEAVEIFRQRRADIRAVLCDLTMPRLDGWETLAALRALAPDLPFVLVSGYDETQVMQGDHQERPQAFLQKPFIRENLRMVLEKVLTTPLP